MQVEKAHLQSVEMIVYLMLCVRRVGVRVLKHASVECCRRYKNTALGISRMLCMHLRGFTGTQS